MTREAELDNALRLARLWQAWDGAPFQAQEMARALLALHGDLRITRDELALYQGRCAALDTGIDEMHQRLVDAGVELTRIRPVYDAACAWRDGTQDDDDNEDYLLNRLCEWIDSARLGSAEANAESRGSDE